MVTPGAGLPIAPATSLIRTVPMANGAVSVIPNPV